MPVATLTLAASPLSGTAPIPAAQIANAPWTGASVPAAIGLLTVGAGTTNIAAQFLPSAATLQQYPIININAALMDAVQRVCLPYAVSCPGLKVRFVNAAPIGTASGTAMPFALSIGAATSAAIVVATAGALAGCLPGSGTAAAAGNASIVLTAASVVANFTATSLSGDFIEFASNGVQWQVTGGCSVAANLGAA